MHTATAVGITTTTPRTSMADPAEFQRLQWFSPAFPVGGYAYSHGIEKAVETGDVVDAETLTGWISDILRLGAGRSDAILLAEAWRRSGETQREVREARLRELAEFAFALGLSRERRLETAQQGAAFHALIRSAWPHDDLPDFGETPLPYPVAAGVAGRVHHQPLVPLANAYLLSFASNLMAAGLRLAVIGQSAAQVRLARLMSVIGAVASQSAEAGLDDLGGMAFRSDMMSLRHETQETRLFRS